MSKRSKRSVNVSNQSRSAARTAVSHSEVRPPRRRPTPASAVSEADLGEVPQRESWVSPEMSEMLVTLPSGTSDPFAVTAYVGMKHCVTRDRRPPTLPSGSLNEVTVGAKAGSLARSFVL